MEQKFRGQEHFQELPRQAEVGLRDLAVAGLGMVSLPTFLHYEAINKGLLKPLFPTYQWSGFDIFVVYPKTTILPKRTRVFVDFIAGLYGKSPYWEDINGLALTG